MSSLIFEGKLFLRIAGKIAKIVKIKNSCHAVSLVHLNFFVLWTACLYILLGKQKQKIVLFVGEKLQRI